MLTLWIYLIAGLVLFYLGAQILVKAGAEMEIRLGLNALVVGLTVIAYVASSPEMVVSAGASLQGNGAIAIGDAVGSNIFNILGILVIAALINPIDASGLSRVDLAMMLIIAVAMIPAARTGGKISRLEGAILLGAYVAYTIWLISLTR